MGKENHKQKGNIIEIILMSIILLVTIIVIVGCTKYVKDMKKGNYIATIEDISMDCKSKEIKIYEKALEIDQKVIVLEDKIDVSTFETYIETYQDTLDPNFILYQVTLANGKQYTINQTDTYIKSILKKNKLSCEENANENTNNRWNWFHW